MGHPLNNRGTGNLVTASEERQHVNWLEGMYLRFMFAFGLLVFTAVVAALILLDHVRVLAGNWADESTAVTALALLTVGATIAAVGCGVSGFLCRALVSGSRG
jgi:hypothetical protein